MLLFNSTGQIAKPKTKKADISVNLFPEVARRAVVKSLIIKALNS